MKAVFIAMRPWCSWLPPDVRPELTELFTDPIVRDVLDDAQSMPVLSLETLVQLAGLGT